ncbi:helix-turn-helix transcriptional regulator [Streptacidiphilus jiangxiensis]|uniref:Helix-turn-helix domain-containing protein n=1 Tax=Streptacidiphilus jiangxiensis TaxID=235985 RepID=A0A1H7ZDJ9_STRJI|nr:helix-turn-helix transcriptional regulator [Streptacidiphilus jiangxiensis]SEM56074.1 Helix-turn-helix domain-containing protein [Streptacidiphilus jiangxiensis]
MNDSSSSSIGGFLRACRDRTTPQAAGLSPGPGARRTPGLRREELASLAGISIDYYIRLERGRETHPSPAVVDSLARALRLDDFEHRHLRDLAVSAAGTRRGSEPNAAPARDLPPGIAAILEALRPNPAYAVSRTTDVLAWNPGGLRLYPGLEQWPQSRRNLARYVFLHPDAPELLDDWDEQIRGCVSRLRVLAGVEPDAPDLVELVTELRAKSPEFAALWDRYDVLPHANGVKAFHHPDVGDVALGYQSLPIEGTPGHRLTVYHATPGTPDHAAMLRLDAIGAQEPAGPTAPAHSPSQPVA